MDFSKFNSLLQLLTYFKNEEVCRRVIIQSRWGDDVVCPYCGGHHCKVGYKGRFVCPYCKNKFSCTVGTIFENTKVSLRKWFTAMYLISSHRKGISSNQLAKDIKVTQKTVRRTEVQDNVFKIPPQDHLFNDIVSRSTCM